MNLKEPERRLNRCTLAQIEDGTVAPSGLRSREPDEHLARTPGVNYARPFIHDDAPATGMFLFGDAGEAVLIIVSEELTVYLQRCEQFFSCAKKRKPGLYRPSLRVHALRYRKVVPQSECPLELPAGRHKWTAKTLRFAVGIANREVLILAFDGETKIAQFAIASVNRRSILQ
jgi:hypothetical protein